MAKDPAFLFYSQDFYVGVQTLNFEDRGKLITLLSLMHQQGRMKEETIRLLVGSISENLKSKFRIDGNGLWYNKRLEEESSKRKKFTESRRRNGKKGGRPVSDTKNKNIKNKNHMVNHMEDENEIENVNEIKSENEDEIRIISREEISFEETRKIYPGTKRGIKTEFENFKKHKDWKEVLPILYDCLHFQIEFRKYRTGFVPEWPHFQTWINQRRWEEEMQLQQNQKNNNELDNFEREIDDQFNY